MSNNQGSKFGSLLDKYSQYIDFEEKLKEKEENEHLQFIQEFIRIRRQIIVPIFDRLKEEAENRSHVVYIETEKPLDEGINIFETYITFYIDLTSSDFRLKHHVEKEDLPHIGFICDIQNEKVRTHESTISPGHGGYIGWQKEFTLDKLNVEVVEQEITNWLEALIRDITQK